MTHPPSDPLSSPEPAGSLAAAPAPQRLDGLTAEWNIEDLPWINSDDGLVTHGEDTARAVSPPAPSQRQAKAAAELAAVARPGAAGPLRPAITVPKKVRPQLAAGPAVLVAADLGATLPPRDERRQLQSDLPSVERDAERPPEGWLARLQTRHWPLAALGTLLCATTTYAVSSGLVHPDEGSAASESALPDFLRDRGATAAASATPIAAEPPPSSGALPPELAATLAQALTPDEATIAPAADAGALPVETEPSAQSAEPSAPEVSEETQRRADALRAALEAKRSESEATEPSSRAKKSSAAASAATSASDRSTGRVTKSSSEASPTPEGARRDERAVSPSPEATAAIRPLTTYTYGDKALFSVATAPMRVTDLVLEPGEKLVSRPTAGDAARWVITVLDSVTRGEPQSHVFVKPLRSGLRTNLTLTTNRRSYFLELSSSDDGKYMAGVQWQYPLDQAERRRQELARAERERQSTTAVSNLEALRFDYRIQVTAGDPGWKPTMVFDDGEKTFIRFPGPVTPARAPLLFVLRSGSVKNAKFVNYRVKNDLYVLDRLIESAELRLDGDDSQDVVRITRR